MNASARAVFFVRLLINRARGRIVLMQVKSHRGEIYIGGRTLLSCHTSLGRNPNFNGMVINGTGEVTIGDNFHSGRDCLLIPSIHNYDRGAAVPYDNTYIEKPIRIADNVWLGDRVVILGGVEIGEGAIIQAGAVVVKSIPPFAIAGGSPAKVFKYRDVEHYKRLKAAGRFH